MRYRITVRGDFIELRGYIDGPINLAEFSEAMQLQFGNTAMIVASEAPEGFDPFGLQQEGGSLGGF